MVFKRQPHATTPAVDLAPVSAGLERARTMYRDASQALFELCYAIQSTGQLPDPVSLSQAIVEYRHARALAEALTLQAAYAADDETILGTPVSSR